MNCTTSKSPMLTNATNGQHNYVKISWTSVLGVNKYIISRSVSKEGPFKKIKTIHTDPIDQPALIHLLDKGIAIKTRYHYQIVAQSVDGINYCASESGFGK